MNWYFFIMAIIVSSIVLFIAIFIISKYLWTRESKIRKYFIKLCITAFTVILLFLVTEVYFRFFFIQTDNFAFTLSSKLWLSKYWTPINSFGYRDTEHSESSLNGKKIIFVVGDSFVAGYGIKNYQDRFPNVLQKKLGQDYVVINIAQGGWATEDEYNAILSYPHKPDIIVLSYSMNDITDSASVQKMGLGINKSINLPPTTGIIKYFCDVSYSFNYFYYRLYRFYKSRDINEASLKNTLTCFLNETIWQNHKSSLLNIINYAKDQKIELIVLVFPLLVTRRAMKFGKIFTSKTVDFMKLNKVTVIDLVDKLMGRDPQELTVNALDGHPSVKLNREIGNLLVEYVYQADNKQKGQR